MVVFFSLWLCYPYKDYRPSSSSLWGNTFSSNSLFAHLSQAERLMAQETPTLPSTGQNFRSSLWIVNFSRFIVKFIVFCVHCKYDCTAYIMHCKTISLGNVYSSDYTHPTLFLGNFYGFYEKNCDLVNFQTEFILILVLEL